MFFQKDLETMGRKEIEALQLERLKHTVRYAYDNVAFYQKRLDEAKINVDKIRTLKDIEYLPFTTKDDLKDNYPFGMFARPKKEIVRIHGSSGTTGKPTLVGYTKNDMDTWSDLIARLCCSVGVTDEDVAQIAFGYGLFTGGFGLHQGLEKLGAMVVPLSSGNSARQLMLMQDLGTTVLVSTPSYAIYLSEMIKDAGNRDAYRLRVGLFGGEGCSPEIRDQIEKNMGIIATDNYGMSELIGPGVSGECIFRDGLHLAEDHFLPEIIDSDTCQAKEKGETGELVVTSLTKEAFPIIRYRTKDITKLNYEPCKCGRTHVRMDKIMGRSDDMLIIKGVNVFPSQIESAIAGMQEVGPHYMLFVRREGIMDSLEVQIELTDGSVLDSYQKLQKIEGNIKSRLHSVLGLNAKVRLVEPRSLQRFEGKAKRVVDLRNEKNNGK
jgi:phenylacetate-CoA ligase